MSITAIVAESIKRRECVIVWQFCKIGFHLKTNSATKLKLHGARDNKRIPARMWHIRGKWKSSHQDNVRPDIKFDGARLEDGFRPNKIKMYVEKNATPPRQFWLFPPTGCYLRHEVSLFSILTSLKRPRLLRNPERRWMKSRLEWRLKRLKRKKEWEMNISLKK